MARVVNAAAAPPPLGPDEVRALGERLRASGAALVLAGGVFDLLHPGHVRYLAAARALGDSLLVALNGDGSAAALKGPGRPLQGAVARAEIVAALAAVDAVTIFEEGDLAAVIRRCRPAVVAKGADYDLARLPAAERDAVAAVGARWAFVGPPKQESSSALWARARAGAAGRTR
ncbi:MAG TPA: adenylyltransferase/cytidyltransferase family protein [Myxococcota bacterium]|jgi:rfaE bifunctional protein nucleotidyltransferase chain/domain|nr:adenylyltransferase/cytidyltransferase family protein [Myxococcota bacterium]